MKNILSLVFFVFFVFFGYSQCFDCGHSIGGHIEDYVVDIDKASDGIVLTINPNQGWGRSIYKYDFNCDLLWSNLFIPDNGPTDFMIFKDTTVDDNDNIYSLICNSRGGVTVGGFSIEMGSSLIKLNPNGVIEWVKKISDECYSKRKVHSWMGNIYVTGQLDEGINNNLGLIVPNGSRSQYFTAKFDTFGNLIKSQLYGTNSYDYFFDSQIDKDGNIYIIGQTQSSDISYYYTTGNPYLTKIDSNLNLVWSKDISSYLSFKFSPLTLYYNNSNDKLYLWSKYYKSTSDFSGCNVGSVIMEISKDTGVLENNIIVDNCGFLQPVGNGTGDVEQRSFMTHEGNNLYVLSSFRGELEVGNQIINSSQTIYNEYNSDLVLYKIDLSDFSAELILRSQGNNTYPGYRDLAGSIVALENSVYLTSSFTSNPITINGNSIVNNSGNNNRDILFYKHILDQTNSTNLISFKNTCYTETTEFLINGNFDSVLWNFDDPPSGLNNTSDLIEANHTFSNSGVYDVTLTVTCGTETEIITIEVVINESPIINQIANLYGCESTYGSQISSSFDTSSVETDLIGNRSNLSIQYFTENGIELPSPLPNPMSNSVLGQETITARIAYIDNPKCYTEISFDLIVKSIPESFQINDLYTCDDDSDGFAFFNLEDIQSNIVSNNTNMAVEFYFENGQLITNPFDAIENQLANEEIITVRATNTDTDCYNETTFKLIVNPLPTANTLNKLIGCDDNNDGISEYFDTSNIESQVLGNQTGLQVSYFDVNGNPLPSPLPNPYTNTIANEELITVRVTNQITTCYSETVVILKTASQPQINQPQTLYACDLGNGFANFNTTHIENEIIGNQNGLKITYFDAGNNQLPSPLPSTFQNTQPWSQIIYARVENELNSLCFSETSFNLIVNQLPLVSIDDSYFLCNLEPSLSVNVESNFDTYNWKYQDGTIISSSYQADLINAGNYTLTVGQNNNDIYCENSFDFKLIRSELPSIVNVEFKELSDDNYIKINASGDGDFEYSIDGINYQNNNLFNNVSGGIYIVSVKDKLGCGEDYEEVVIIDYPKYFTPNGDGVNDTWQIKGITDYPNAEIFIHDRYGKLLKQISAKDEGWDGTFRGQKLTATDYWFTVKLNDNNTFTGHFALKR
ncbi:T9SS type B sorting domain-containing protein [Confluentibacter citreus]|uniref:T9SS type B sorting domain-containing protein n=1 Tax=Confluentibacter citreus TaxID=2007307 RepID=UPI000C285557|nr:T9SS type B sorting domain-containing protein [Confluentibacter citreus]